MKNLQHFNRTAIVILGFLIITAQNTKANPTVCTYREYNGTTILHCELAEVVISADKPLNLAPETTFHNGEEIISVSLPEVVITAQVSTPSVPTEIQLSEPEITLPVIDQPEQNTEPTFQPHMMVDDKDALKRRPLIPFIANKIFDGSVWFLKRMNEGLFFRS